MKVLYLARHAKSSWDDPSARDIDRPLNKRGLRDAPFMGKLLAGMGETPEVILTSTAARALATARAYGDAFGLPPEMVVETGGLYMAGSRALLVAVHGLDDRFSRAMIVGHNPGMTQFAGELAPGGPAHMPTCAVAAFELAVDSWTMVRTGEGNLRFFETPKGHLPRH